MDPHIKKALELTDELSNLVLQSQKISLEIVAIGQEYMAEIATIIDLQNKEKPDED